MKHRTRLSSMDALPDQPILKLQRCNADPLLADVYYETDSNEAEEKVASECLRSAEPVESAFHLEQLVDAHTSVYGGCFKTREDLTEFMMLPLNEAQRQNLLVVMSQDVRAQRAMEEAKEFALRHERRKEKMRRGETDVSV